MKCLSKRLAALAPGLLLIACGAGTVAGNTNVPCTPTTCAAQGKNCGTVPNDCGGALDCGSCSAPEICGGSGTTNLCGIDWAGISNELFHSAYPNAFVDRSGNPVLINGFNVKGGVIDLAHNWTFGADKYAFIKAAGFNTVRFALNWPDYEGAGSGQFSSAALALLQTAVQNAKRAGLYIILDPIHLKGGGTATPSWATGTDSIEILNTSGKPFLRKIAETYKDEASVIAYDVVNEPWQANLDQNRVLRMYAGLMSAIREIDPDKILILEPTWGDSSIANADFSILPDTTNVVWSIHDYFAGGDDDGYSPSGTPAGAAVWDGTSGYASPDAGQIEKHIVVNLDKLATARLPLFIGEYGIADGATNQILWLQHHQAAFNKYSLPRTYWSWNWSTMAAAKSDYSLKSWVVYLK